MTQFGGNSLFNNTISFFFATNDNCLTSQYTTMLHELLLALLGYTGDLIIDLRDNNLSADTPISDECTFKLAPDISFIDPSDRELIERIITLAFYYRELERFLAKSRNLNWIRSENANPLENKEKPSVYRRALAMLLLHVFR